MKAKNSLHLSLAKILGYFDRGEFLFTWNGEPSAARQAILDAGGTKTGNGMQSGTVQAKVRDGRVSICLFAPQTRSLHGPIFDGLLKATPTSVLMLEGRFRMTAVEIVSFA